MMSNHPILPALHSVSTFAVQRMARDDISMERWYRARKLADAADDMAHELRNEEAHGEAEHADSDGAGIREALFRLGLMVPFNDDTNGLMKPIPGAMRSDFSKELSLAIADAWNALFMEPGVVNMSVATRLVPLTALDIALKWARENDLLPLSSVLLRLRPYYVGGREAPCPLVDAEGGYQGCMVPTDGWGTTPRKVLNKGRNIFFRGHGTFEVIHDVFCDASGHATIPISPKPVMPLADNLPMVLMGPTIHD